MNILSIKETCIYVKELDRTKEFYTKILGLLLISLVKERHVFFRAGQSMLLCFLSEATQQEKELPPHGAHGRIHFAFEVSKEEYNNALLEVRNSGIEILHEHQWKNHLRSFFFHDPDYNVVEIIEQGLWEQ
jgi:catechol 2,3-dioxygenase-like lactoylglutathione lyase family enzyme